MSSRRSSTTSVRLRRGWVRLGLMSGVAAGACALVIAVLVDDDEQLAPRTHVSSPSASASARELPPEDVSAPPRVDLSAAPSSPRRPATRSAPTSAGQVLRQDVTLTAAELATWIGDRELDAQVRYGALRRLEREDPAGAVTAALAVLDDVTPLVRLNAIALLTRSSDPRAGAALEKLDDRSRLLAAALVRRGS